MAWSFKDKLEYNRKQDTNFSFGYSMGANIYNDYVKLGEKNRADVKKLVDGFKELARGGDEFSKGFMCAYRDAANERKYGKKTSRHTPAPKPEPVYVADTEPVSMKEFYRLYGKR